MRMPKLLVAFVIALFPTSQGNAEERWILPLEESSWRSIKVPGTVANTFTIGKGKVTIQSNNSASFRYYELPARLRSSAEVQWRWRVETYSNLFPQSERGQDDRPLAVHLWFDDSAGASLFGVVGSALGYPKVGHLMTYVWGAEEASGSVLRNPYYSKGRVIVLVGQNAPTGEWRSVRRDIARDFSAAFGTTADLTSLRYIAVSADNDDHGGQSVATVAALSLVTP